MAAAVVVVAGFAAGRKDQCSAAVALAARRAQWIAAVVVAEWSGRRDLCLCSAAAVLAVQKDR